MKIKFGRRRKEEREVGGGVEVEEFLPSFFFDTYPLRLTVWLC